MNMSKSMWLRAFYQACISTKWWEGRPALAHCASDCQRLQVVDQAKYLGYWLGACTDSDMQFAAAFRKMFVRLKAIAELRLPPSAKMGLINERVFSISTFDEVFRSRSLGGYYIIFLCYHWHSHW